MVGKVSLHSLFSMVTRFCPHMHSFWLVSPQHLTCHIGITIYTLWQLAQSFALLFIPWASEACKKCKNNTSIYQICACQKKDLDCLLETDGLAFPIGCWHEIQKIMKV